MLKSCTVKKNQAKRAKKPATGKYFVSFALPFSTFHNSFDLFERAFHGGSTTFLEINLVHN